MSKPFQIVATKGDAHYLLATFSYAKSAKTRQEKIANALRYFRGTVQLIEGTSAPRFRGKFAKRGNAASFKQILTEKQIKAVRGLF